MRRLRLPKNKTLVLDVAIWARQTDNVVCGCSKLLNDHDNMCCLGQFCHQLGVDKSLMRDRNLPDELEYATIPLMVTKSSVNSFCSLAVGINDDNSTDDFQKIRKLQRLCRENGIKLIVKNRDLAVKHTK